MQLAAKKLSSSYQTSTLVVFVTAKTKGGKKGGKEPHFVSVDSSIRQLVNAAAKEEAFQGSAKETLFFRNANVGHSQHLLVVGLGESPSHEVLRNCIAEALKCLKMNKVYAAAVLLDSVPIKPVDVATQALVEGAELFEYDYDEQMTDENIGKSRFKKLEIVHGTKLNASAIKKGLKAGEVLSDSINFAKRLGDMPGNLMTPEILANTTRKKATGTGLRVTIWDKARIKKERFGGLTGVSLGSEVPPRFIIMEYKGGGTKKPIAFVGKGLTFDCGGISIKPSAAMDEMKYDMCGGANVIGTMLAIARLKLKINAVGYVPASENMPGGLANKPGDILKARNGKTVEVLNTDAEGRLILMDALSYATEKKPQAIFDAATLTGAMVIALSNIHTGYFTKDDKLSARIEKAAKSSGELVWRLPLHKEHAKDMKGRHADLQNIGKSRGAGSSTAAAFLSHFVSEDIPWAHFDIAGTAWNAADRLSYCRPKGATGAIVRTFVELAASYGPKKG